VRVRPGVPLLAAGGRRRRHGPAEAAHVRAGELTPGGLLDRLRRHRPEGPDEAAHLAAILAFVTQHANPFDRRIPHGHLTGSAFVFSPDGRRILMLHHRKLDRWLQPGGHADTGESEGEEVALREAREETGIATLRLHPDAPRPLDVDVHAIPARGSEPAHLHLDLRYVVIAPEGAALLRDAKETNALRWFGWEELPGLGLDDGLRRGLAKAANLFR
jgi:8-oxo-dGTP pyrophosphatase MutT (NUDIX family)